MASGKRSLDVLSSSSSPVSAELDADITETTLTEPARKGGRGRQWTGEERDEVTRED